MTRIDSNLNVSESYLNDAQDNRVIEDINKRLILNRNELRSTIGTVDYLELLGESAIKEDPYIGQMSQNNLLLSAAINGIANSSIYARDEKVIRWYNREHCLKRFSYIKVY